MTRLLLLWAFYLAGFQSVRASNFGPGAYTKQYVKCPALRRDEDRKVEINLSYVDVNPTSKTSLLLVHGWPGLWSTWYRQIEEFQRDYRLIIPDLRGFGSSEHPGDVRSSTTMPDLVGDLECILRHVAVENTICVGHDWGSQLCYEAARSRPDMFTGVVGVTVPYIPAAGDFVPTSHLTAMLPKLTYQLYFDETPEAVAKELTVDVRRTLRAILGTKGRFVPEAFLTSKTTFMDAWDGHDIPPIKFFDEKQEDYMVESYAQSGFENTLGFYTTENKKVSWQFAHDQGNFTLPQPVLAIYPDADPVANWTQAVKILGSDKFLNRLSTSLVAGSHWPHVENPEEVNPIIRTWLNETFPLDGPQKESERMDDEL